MGQVPAYNDWHRYVKLQILDVARHDRFIFVTRMPCGVLRDHPNTVTSESMLLEVDHIKVCIGMRAPTKVFCSA